VCVDPTRSSFRAIHTPPVTLSTHSPIRAQPRASTAIKRRTPAQKRAAAGRRASLSVPALRTLHAVLEPKISKPKRSTKPLTLPEDVQLATGRRMRSEQQQVRRCAAGGVDHSTLRWWGLPQHPAAEFERCLMLSSPAEPLLWSSLTPFTFLQTHF